MSSLIGASINGLFGVKARYERGNIPFSLHYLRETIYTNIKVIWLAEKCKTGDVLAMKRMAAFFRARCTDKGRRLLNRYEAEPVKENEDTCSVYFETSENLLQAGFIDVPGGYEECHISFNKQLRCFSMMYLSSYEPADEDGFGAEWDYSDFYFDEFFCRLSVNSEEELPDALRRIKKKRGRKSEG